MSDIWLISDPHFGHKIAARERGFEHVIEHDRALIRNCRRVFRAKSQVYWLGDMAFGGWEEKLREVMPQIPGEHHLILGNHDRAHPLNPQGERHQVRFYRLGFSSVSVAGQLRYEGQKILLSHFPYDGDHTEDDRHTQWRLRDEGRPLVYGHKHTAERLTFSQAGTPQLHVGVDAWDLKPVSMFDAMQELLRG